MEIKYCGKCDTNTDHEGNTCMLCGWTNLWGVRNETNRFL